MIQEDRGRMTSGEIKRQSFSIETGDVVIVNEINKSYSDDKDRSRKGSQLLLEGSRRDAENRIIPHSIDADDSDGETNNDDQRLVILNRYTAVMMKITLKLRWLRSCSNDEDYDDDEDNTEAMMVELERIKKERAEEKLRQKILAEVHEAVLWKQDQRYEDRSSSDGNLLDSLGAAIKATLANTAIPRVNVSAKAAGDEQPVVDISDEELLQFDTSAVPLIIKLTKMSSAVLISINRKDHICGLMKRGGACLDPSVISDMVFVEQHLSE
ncbi:Putative exosome complex exonuclease RRP42 [Linum perenne]